MDKMPKGYVDVLAKQHKAKAVASEHRFYGQITPKNDLSTETLRFLTLWNQALADVNHFIHHLYDGTHDQRQPVDRRGHVVSWRSLSAWFRIAYLNATVAAISSSGVVNPFL
ncbi:hypothetical protein H257_15553 [Aphanomyces astaci]|uniref:Uncharacterized protein n=1 Tax=Aphanomyces astaci TaxID=112090 RepID=W4FM94_APHAT|nr:hypothetical protein H257_15553 [Aphanomyces astaci]ETV68575.1 hypothetical protein H257_15553 [Aphanomyces astaci]|eukprot:XP_009842004.1 hypothetical protein H257_15553 [Aphanomyces astaci]